MLMQLYLKLYIHDTEATVDLRSANITMPGT
jgi:hypothetical protein